jgi:hypothetical protein
MTANFAAVHPAAIPARPATDQDLCMLFLLAMQPTANSVPVTTSRSSSGRPACSMRVCAVKALTSAVCRSAAAATEPAVLQHHLSNTPANNKHFVSKFFQHPLRVCTVTCHSHAAAAARGFAGAVRPTDHVPPLWCRAMLPSAVSQQKQSCSSHAHCDSSTSHACQPTLVCAGQQ